MPSKLEKMPVSGATRLSFIIGDPIAQVRSPEYFNVQFENSGIDWVMAPLWVSGGQLDVCAAGLRTMKNLAAIVVTVPHKVAMLDMCDTVSERATLVGAVNAIRVEQDGSWHGNIFDGVGFTLGLKAQGTDCRGRSVFIAGAGGVGRAVAFALAEAGVGHIRIHDIDGNSASKLTEKLRERFGTELASQSAQPDVSDEILINCTPLGMQPEDDMPLPAEALRPGRLVADLVMKPHRTRLLDEAEGRGCEIFYGVSVLQHQLPGIFEFFFGADEDGKANQSPAA